MQHTLKIESELQASQSIYLTGFFFFPFSSNEKVQNLQEVIHRSTNDLFSLKISIAQLENH